MTKSIKQYLRKPPSTARLQGQVDRDLFLRTRKIMKAQGLSWAVILEACLKMFCEENEKR